MKKLCIGVAGTIAAIALGFPEAAQTLKPSAATSAVDSMMRHEASAGDVIKEIEDPSSGMRWLLVEDPAHPGGPGRMVISGEGRWKPAGRRGSAKIPEAKPVIHAGEAVQVEEHSAVVNASLQAVALGSAARGGALRVRLRIGGRVLKARALGPGRAALQLTGGRPW